MMKKLELEVHSVVSVETTVLQKGTYVKLQGILGDYGSLQDLRGLSGC